MVLNHKWVEKFPWVVGEPLPQVEEFKHPGVLFPSRMEREMDHQIVTLS